MFFQRPECSNAPMVFRAPIPKTKLSIHIATAKVTRELCSRGEDSLRKEAKFRPILNKNRGAGFDLSPAF